MRIEIWRKLIGADYRVTCCAICGNDFDRGNVFPVASGDRGGEIGEMCLACLDYLSRRKDDEADPTLDNWPARDWPTVEDVEEARLRYPEPMFADEEEFAAAASDIEAEDRLVEASIIWAMKREVLAE